jgi:ankyrin repeat protein
MDIAANYINEIVENCLIKSFYFLYKVDSSIINIVDSDNNNILHNIKEKNKFEDMITLLIKLDDSILFKKNKSNQNPLLKHAKDNNLQIVKVLIKLIIENNNETIFESTDNLKNNVLHYLCMKDDVINLIKQVIIIKPDILNYQNKSYETPLIICAKFLQENNLYFLRSIKADMDLADINGNSVYHYICLNELCIGMDIENKENIFGYKPSDYCKISTNYYYFI